MINNKGRVLPRENILNHVWGYDSEVFSRTVDTHITRLREKLESYGKYLESVRGVGYRWLEN
jgi:two-component system phosphate regulon response regulator PhoB